MFWTQNSPILENGQNFPVWGRFPGSSKVALIRDIVKHIYGFIRMPKCVTPTDPIGLLLILFDFLLDG
jgi:hypothetical protein